MGKRCSKLALARSFSVAEICVASEFSSPFLGVRRISCCSEDPLGGGRVGFAGLDMCLGCYLLNSFQEMGCGRGGVGCAIRIIIRGQSRDSDREM